MKLRRKNHVRFNPASAYSVLAGAAKSETGAMDVHHVDHLLGQIDILQRQLKTLQNGSASSDVVRSDPKFNLPVR